MLAKTSQDANAILISFKFQLQKYLGPLLLFIHCKKTLFGGNFHGHVDYIVLEYVSALRNM